MLFSYTYVPHRMETMQKFIDFIFFEVWCKAPIGLPFHTDLFDGNPPLKEVMSEFGFSANAPERGKAFYKDVRTIYECFAPLSAAEIQQFKKWYLSNNDVEKVCANDPAATPVRYSEMPAAHQGLCSELNSFFKGLYSQSLLGLAAIRAKIGDIDDHYDAFMAINDEGKCPFCGISDILGAYHSKREAYDHYLPKALYPFNSINFKNLVPACHHCNSSYKTSKDPAHPTKDPASNGQRRRVFYPYVTYKKINVSLGLAHANFKTLTPGDISIDFGPLEVSEELATWRDVYGIDERYKAKIVAKNDGKYWIAQAFDEWPAKGRDVHQYMVDLAEQADACPFADCNFLKQALLEACLNVVQPPGVE